MKLRPRLEALLEIHDKVEEAILVATRVGIARQGLWEYHDWIEREILKAEAKLPPDVLEELIA